MALIIADRVKETATTTGTGTFTLGGAVTGFRTFNAGIGTGNTTYYCIFLDGTNEFEVGLGTYTAPDQLARDTVLTSSNSGSKVNFSQGIKSVFCTQPSSKAAYLDASGNLSITTSNITEGTNLYYTDARFDTRLATKDTADLSEGTNLYYTDARARAAISVSGNAIAYNSSTGVITANFEESPTFTGNVIVSGNLTVTGTTTWLDSTNTQISDKNIVLNYASGDSSANADGAGITIQDAVDASNDASLTWDTTLDAFKFSNNLHFNDGIQANFGTSSDLQILHDGSHSYIKDVGTGSLRIRGTDLLLESQGGETFLYAANNGAVTLYHNNAAKLATTSSGIDVSGNIIIPWSNTYKFTGSVNEDVLDMSYTGGVGDILNIAPAGDSATSEIALKTTVGSTVTERVRIKSNGNVGIGTTSPSEKLEVSGKILATGGQVRAGSYLESFPSFSFANDTDTGMFSDTANQLEFSTGGTSRMAINSSGNVGIGTTSPLAKLESYVSGNFSTTYNDFSGDGLYIQTNGTAGVGEYTAGLSFSRTVANNARAAGIAGVQDGSDADQVGLAFFTHPSTGTAVALQESLRISSDGNVGIGTSSPVTPLHINSSTTESLIQMTNSSTGTTSSDGFRFGAIGTSVALINREAGAMTFSTSNAEKMRIDSAGNLGIGTTSPANTLSILGSVNQLDIETTTAGVTLESIDRSDLNAQSDLSFYARHGEYKFFGSSYTERMRIDTSGNVGIGTNSPSAKLEVAGSVGNFQTTGHQIKLTRNGNNEIYAVGASSVLALGTQDSEDMRIDSSGNVGIGTTSPSAKLEVNGGADAIAKITGTTTAARLDLATTTHHVFMQVIESDGRFRIYDQTAANEYLTISNAGNVGIGTTSPSEKLHVDGNIKTTGTIYSGGALRGRSGDSSKLILNATSTTTELHAAGTTGTVFKDNGNNERARIDGSGNFGIGTSSPSEKLHISSASPVIRLEDTTDPQTSGGSVGKIEFYGNDGSSGGAGVRSYLQTVSTNAAGNDHALAIGLSGSNAAPTEKIRLTNTGLGIGTSSPSQKLDVVGEALIQGRLQIGASTPDLLFSVPSGGVDSRIFNDGSGNFIIGHGTNSSTPTERLRIDSSGNVGIGTDSPQSKLDVRGDIELNSTFPVLRFKDSDSENDFSIIGGSGLFRIYDEDATASRISVNSSGNVGIGTTSPDTLLNLAGDETAVIRLENSNGSASDGDVIGALQFYKADASGAGAGVVGQMKMLTQGVGSGGHLTLSTGDANGNDAERLRISSNGNVGIGTASPSRKLHINGGTANFVAKFESTDGIGGILVADNSTSVDLAVAAEGNNLSFYNNSERMRIDSSGNVGIGTSSPAFTSGSGLEIERGGTTTLRLQNTAAAKTVEFNMGADLEIKCLNSGSDIILSPTANVGIGTTSPSQKLTVDDGTGASTIGLQPDGTNGAYIRYGGSSGTVGNTLRFLGVSNTEYARFNQSGNFGIGTTSPSRTLDVRSAGIPANLQSTSTAGGLIDLKHAGTAASNAGAYNGIRFYNGDGFKMAMAHITEASGSGYLQFGTNWAADTGDVMAIHSSGNVGIGTTSPSEKLEVDGGTSTTLFINSSTHNSGVANEAILQFGYGHSGSPDAVGNIKLVENSTNSFDGNMVFSVPSNNGSGGSSTAEAMRIRYDGNFLVGTTSTPSGTVEGISNTQSGVIYAAAAGTAPVVLYRHDSDGNIVNFHRDGTQVGTISVTGSATAYNTSSDARLKDITGSARGLEVINELNPVAYDWKADGKSDEGLIAQEVKELVPNAVSETEDGYYQMDYSKLVTPLIKAVQELTAKVESLEAQLANK